MRTRRMVPIAVLHSQRMVFHPRKVLASAGMALATEPAACATTQVNFRP